MNAQMYNEINNHFSNAYRISTKELKGYLQSVYAKYNYMKTAKGLDIRNFGFNVIPAKLRDKHYNRINGFILIKL